SRGGRRYGDGQAGAAVPRRHPRGARTGARAGGRVPRLGRIRDARGGGAQRLGRSRPGDDGVAPVDPPRRRRFHSHLLRQGGGASPHRPAMTLSRTLFEKARELIPGGVNSPVRAFRAVGGDPIFFARGQGAMIYDVDGNGYIDYVGSWGPLIL